MNLRVAIIITTCLSAWAGAAAPAAATLVPNGNWVFSGTDYGDDDARGVNDPMTLLFMGGYSLYAGHRRETMDAIVNIYETDWPGDMGRKRCNFPMWLRYRLYPGTRIDATDGNVSSSHTCDNQWHSRLWNDREVNASAQWVVGGVHYETRCVVPRLCHHRLRKTFEEAENFALWYLRSHCSLSDWRALPGSGPRSFRREYGKFFSNGKISRISMQYINNTRPYGEKCRGAFR